MSPVGRNASTCLPDASNRIVTCAGGLAWPGATSANSSLRSKGFSTSPTTWRVTPFATKRIADVHVEGRRGIVGHRDVVGAGRETPGDEAQRRMPVRPVRVLGAEIHRVAGSRDRDALVVDLLDRAERTPRRRDIRAVGTDERHRSGRGPHRGVERKSGVVREGHSRRSSPRPRTPSAPPRAPAGATRDGTVATTSGRSPAAPARRPSRADIQFARSLLERQAHDFASGASSDSGPAGGIV